MKTETANRRTESRLSESQKAVWTYCHIHRCTPAYHICMRFGPYPDIQKDRLKAAIERAVNNHPIVKARITTAADGEPRMILHDDEPPIIDEITTSESESSAIIDRFCTPIDIDGGRLYRLTIMQTERGVSLLANFHHVIFDGISMNILLDDISAAYAGMPLQAETDDQTDVARKENERRKTADYDAARRWHESVFAPTTVRTMPPADRYDANEPQTAFEIFPTSITIDRWEDICRRAGYSGNIVSMAAFALMLGCYTGEEEVRFSTVFHGRHGKSMQRTVGMMVQTLPVGARWESNTPLKDLMHALRWQQARCMLNDIHTFGDVRKHCGGFGEVNFIYQGNTTRQEQFCGFPLLKKFLMPSVSGTRLAIELWYEGERLDLYAEYDASIYSREMVATMMKTFETVLNSMASAKRVGDIRLTDDAMLARLDALNGAEDGGDCTESVVEMFRKRASETPEAIAVKDAERQITYRELDLLSDRLGAALQMSGIKKGDVVALMLPRDASLPVATLAVLKCGAAYLPCPIAESDAVIGEQWKDSEAIMIITTDSLATRALAFPGQMVLLDVGLLICNLDEDYYHIDINIAPDDLFALFYTSGSTGKSKAVRVTHRNVSAYCRWYKAYFQPREGIVIGAYNNFAFDASITDMFTSLATGATLSIVPEEVKNDIREVEKHVNDHGIEIIDMPTQIGRLFAMHCSCPSLRHIVLGGEALTPLKACRDYNIYNQYGPTETTVAVTIYKLRGDEKCVPIGQSMTGVRLYVVDSADRRVPIGAPGELLIAGNQVADGYHQRKKETEKAFTKNPFCSEKPFDRVFRTGDIVRYREDGMLEFLGRKDGMVKIRGFRVELNAVESALRGCKDVEEAAANAFPDGHGGMMIAAYLVSQKRLDIAAIRQEMVQKVAAAMVPQVMEQTERLPLTPNGKVDRRALPTPDQRANDGYEEPKNERERAICDVFCSVLGKEKVGAEADFFALGGTSITAVHVLTQLEQHGIVVQYADIFAHSTARTLAEWLDSRHLDDTDGGTTADLSTIRKTIAEGNRACIGSTGTTPLHDVLLTGATGFLGIHILSTLLSQGKGRVWCVVRRTDEKPISERLLGVLHHYFGTKHDDEFAKRVEIIDGDMTMAATFDRIKGTKSDDLTVINCAAMVKHFAPREQMERINVASVSRLADYCMQNGARLVHISTLNTAVRDAEKASAEGQMVTEQTFNALPSTANPYAMTKWEAEKLLLERAREGLKVKIMRMGNLCIGMENGVLQSGYEHNATLNWLRILGLVGCCPKGFMNVPVEFTPVDWSAKAVLSLAETPATGSVFHVFCKPKQTVGDVVSALSEIGIDVKTVSEDVFAQRINALSANEKAGHSLAVARETPSFGAPQFCWSNDFTSQVMTNRGWEMPHLPHDYIRNVIEKLASNAFFN